MSNTALFRALCVKGGTHPHHALQKRLIHGPNDRSYLAMGDTVFLPGGGGREQKTFQHVHDGAQAGQAHLAIERVFRYSDQVTLPSEAPGMERRPPYGYARALVVS